jgi:hypothetical protein
MTPVRLPHGSGAGIHLLLVLAVAAMILGFMPSRAARGRATG